MARPSNSCPVSEAQAIDTNSTVDVVIVNYNAGELLARCLMSLIGNRSVASVTVVDNASHDDSLAVAADAIRSVGARVTRNTANIGFGAAVNQAAGSLNRPFLLVMNPDCIVADGAIDRAVQSLQASSDVGLLGAWVVGEDGQELRGTRRRLPDLRNTLCTFTGLARLESKYPSLRGVNLSWQPAPTARTEVEAVSGAFMLLRKSLFDRLAGFDEGYFLHCEDLDLFTRIQAKGFSLLLEPSVVVTHWQGTPSRSAPIKVWYHKHRSMHRYYKLHTAKQVAWPLRWLIPAAIWSRFLLLLPLVWLRR